MREINNVNDLMIEAGKALAARDADRLEELKRIAGGWLQTEYEEEAQMALLESMIDACCELEEFDL